MAHFDHRYTPPVRLTGGKCASFTTLAHPRGRFCPASTAMQPVETSGACAVVDTTKQIALCAAPAMHEAPLYG
jgi:hypothetical protein